MGYFFSRTKNKNIQDYKYGFRNYFSWTLIRPINIYRALIRPINIYYTFALLQQPINKQYTGPQQKSQQHQIHINHQKKQQSVSVVSDVHKIRMWNSIIL
jgi:hypothetical protein